MTFVPKTHYKPDGAKGHACNPSTWKVERQEDHQFKDVISYVVSLNPA